MSRHVSFDFLSAKIESARVTTRKDCQKYCSRLSKEKPQISTAAKLCDYLQDGGKLSNKMEHICYN